MTMLGLEPFHLQYLVSNVPTIWRSGLSLPAMLLIVCRLIVYSILRLSQGLVGALMKTIEQQFGERVRQLRLQKNLSQEDLAFKAGVHRTYLGGIERGERNPSLKNIVAIATALDVTLVQLFFFNKSD